MCDVTTAAFVAAAVIGAGTAVYSADQQAKAAEETGRNLASQAGQAQDGAAAEAEQIRQAARRQRAAAQAAYAASGVDVGTGSAIKIDQTIAKGGEYDALNAIISGGNGAKSLTAEALTYGKAAKAARTAGYASAASTLMSAGASYAQASGWRQNGPGYSGGQTPAPIVDRSIRVNG